MSTRPAAFLDRDGTIIREVEYLSAPDRVELLPGAVAALRALSDAGYALVTVSNQSGIARGYYTEVQYRAVQARLLERLEAEGVALAGCYHCPHHPDLSGPCDCRKPATGLYRLAARDLGLDPAASLYIGDRVTDVLPARELGGRALLVRTGYGAREAAGAPSWVSAHADLAAAVRAVLGHPEPVDTPGDSG